MAADLIPYEVAGIVSRKLTDETAKHFQYGKGTYKGNAVQVAPYFDADGKMVAQKIRGADKAFTILGSLENALPFGANAFQKTGKSIIVTEGEIDALSMSQVQGNKWPVVSIACGAGAQTRKYIAKHRDYFLGFEKVILMFDMDGPGQEAARVAAQVIGRRAHIASMTLKDANEMLKAGKTEDLINAMWRAVQYKPEGILDMASLREEVLREPEIGLSWWTPELTDLTYGIRTGEIYCFGAGTGVGKTDFFTQQVDHMISVHNVPVAYFALEQSPRETATRLAGKHIKKILHIPGGDWTRADKERALDEFDGLGKVFLYDSFGANEWDIIREKFEYLAHAEGVKYFFLDHLTALAAAEEDERKALEKIMAEMGALVKKLDIALFLISHLATPEGKPHEEGGRVMIRHFKGSRAIGFWCAFMFGLERNQQAESEAFRTTTTLRILKDRNTGRGTGKLVYLGYESETGMLYETTDPATRDGQTHGFKDESAEAPAGSDF